VKSTEGALWSFAPSEEKCTVVIGAPFGTNFTATEGLDGANGRC
jgi:hypothetical protein